MGKKRIVKQKGQKSDSSLKNRSLSRTTRKRVGTAILHVNASFNNTKVILTDLKGDVIAFSSAGSLGFKGAKKGTPFAAAKVGELIGEKAQIMGVTDVSVTVKGAGAGRESAIRSFFGLGIGLNRIQDKTPIAHNGTRPRKPRRV